MACGSLNAQQLSELRSQIRQLIKFVALNYLAVVKAIKKRNRHCKVRHNVTGAAGSVGSSAMCIMTLGVPRLGSCMSSAAIAAVHSICFLLLCW